MVQAIKRPEESGQMLTLVREIVEGLNEIAGLEMVWKRGILHTGGPHYRIKGSLSPISPGEDECFVLGRLIEAFKPRHSFIIGNGFGMSGTFVSKMMEEHGGSSVVTLDNRSEGDGEACYRTAAQISERMGCQILNNKWGWSPQDLAIAAVGNTYDLVLFDGDHSHPQVTRDFHGVQSVLSDDAILCWHYYWKEGVASCIDEAGALGYRCLKLNTSSELVLGTRSEERFQRLMGLFSDGETPVRRRRPVAYLKLYNAMLSGAVKTYFVKNQAVYGNERH
jgi:hypothetical protein